MEVEPRDHLKKEANNKAGHVSNSRVLFSVVDNSRAGLNEGMLSQRWHLPAAIV